MELFQRFMWPELRAIPPQWRRKVIEHWQYRHRMGPRAVAELAVLALGWIAVLVVGVAALAWDDTPQHLSALMAGTVRLVELVVMALIAGLLMRGMSRVLRREFQGYLKATWRQGRAPICYGCGYDLRGSGGTSCPECGEGIPMLGE